MDPLNNLQILYYVKKLRIRNFRGVYRLDEIPVRKRKSESAIVNLAKSGKSGSHWVAFWRRGKDKIYFDSFGGPIPREILMHLKTKRELVRQIPCVQISTEQLQSYHSMNCGQFCLYILYTLSISKEHSFDAIINSLRRPTDGGFERFCFEIRTM